MKDPRVSVVMPVFNQERFVLAAIRSVLEGSFTDIELVVVDDGSTDRTNALLRAHQDSRIRIITREHLGFSRALAEGVRASRAPLVARMDSDDLSLPDRLAVQVDFMDSNPECVFVTCNYGLVTEGNKFLAPIATFDNAVLAPNILSANVVPFCDPGTVFRRESALEVGLYDDDLDNEKPLWYKLLSKGRGVVLGRPLYYARVLYGSHSRSKQDERAELYSAVRRRYDPEYSAQSAGRVKGVHGSRELAAVRKVARVACAAGDYRAARKVAVAVVRRSGPTPEAFALLARCMIGFRSIRTGFRPSTLAGYVRVKNPWELA